MSVTQTPSIVYESANRSKCVAAGPIRRRFPLPANSPIQFAAYEFDQEFELLLTDPTSGTQNFPPAPKNTPSNATSGGSGVFAGLLDGNAILTKLTQPSPTGGGKGKFTASFAVVPASWDDFATKQVTFPGWINTPTSGLARAARSRCVMVRLHYDYFVVDPAGILTGAGVLDSGGSAITLVTSMGVIPMALRAVWLNTGGGTPQPHSEVNDLVPSGGVTIGTTSYVQTYPTYEQYSNWISNAATALAGGAWSASNPAIWDKLTSGSNIATAGQFQFDDSALRVYSGNIIERCLAFAIPQ